MNQKKEITLKKTKKEKVSLIVRSEDRRFRRSEVCKQAIYGCACSAFKSDTVLDKIHNIAKICSL